MDITLIHMLVGLTCLSEIYVIKHWEQSIGEGWILRLMKLRGPTRGFRVLRQKVSNSAFYFVVTDSLLCV